jgi:hypothetical protein
VRERVLSRCGGARADGTIIAYAAVMHRILIVAVPVFAVLGAYDALACGGMFCSQTSPTPIDQSAEKILFEARPDGSVIATVEIKYNGDPQNFVWIVPVSGTPDFVDVAAKDTLLLLDAATRPTIIPPTVNCTNPPFSPNFGCDADAAPPFAADRAVGEGEGEGGVNVTNYPSAGPFDGIVVVEGNNPDVLMTWLRDHDYQVTEEMRPFIEQYTLEGHSFLATRLQADADVNDMVPIRFHCPQPNPTIPLRLTAVAAEPDMAFTVFVVGSERYEMAPGYENVTLAVDELQSSFGVTNYFALVSKKIDEAGGRGFIVERAENTAVMRNLVNNAFLGTEGEQAARDSVLTAMGDQQFVTRFYARMNAEEMTLDPVFMRAGNNTSFSAFDLSSRVYESCPANGEEATQPPTPPTCGTLYCGQGDACAQSDFGIEGCVCRDGHVARVTSSPTGGSQIICMSPEIDVHGGAGNPCAGQTCGNAGTCLPVNDRPTCACNEGTVAVFDGQRMLCTGIAGEVFESDQILWPEPIAQDEGTNDDGGGCTTQGERAGGAASIALWFIGVAALRRVLRKR